MPTYKYIAKDINGKNVRGSISSKNRSEFFTILKKQNLFCMRYTQKDETVKGLLQIPYKMGLKDLAVFCRQISAMLTAGIPIITAINILHTKSTKKKYKNCMLKLYESVQKGNSLSEAMEEQRSVFPTLLKNMVKSGEVGGTLDSVMLKMADHYDSELKLRNKIRNISIYPIILLATSIVIIVAILVFVMPIFVTLFTGVELPASTRFLLSVSYSIKNYWYIILVVLAMLGLIIPAILKIRSVRYFIDKSKLKIPVLGKLIRTIYTARCSRALSTLYSSGVSIIQTLEMTSDILNNLYVSEKIDKIINDIKRGVSLGTAIEKTDVFDPMFNSMVFVAEESGSLDLILSKTASHFDEEAEASFKNIVSLMEPTMLICLGLIVGFIVISIITPIFNMYSKIQ